MSKLLIPLLAILTLSQCALASYQITVELPPNQQAASATAVNSDMKMDSTGRIDGQHVVFSDLLPDSPYDLRINLSDGTVLQGVDMSWYSMEPASPDAGPITDDDKKEITDIVEKVTTFFNKNRIVLLSGTHERAVVLAEQIKDNGFHSDKGGEVIWRPELWFFKYEHGGWEKQGESQKVLRRERFANQAAFDAEVKKLQWAPQLGGVHLTKAEPSVTIKLPAENGQEPASKPSDSQKQ